MDNEVTGGRYLDIITNSLSQTLTIEELDRLEELYNNRGIAKGKLQAYRGAIQDYNKAIELNPNFYEVFYYSGLVKANLKDFRGAIKDYDKTIELNPNHTSTYYRRGLVKIILQQIDSGCLDLSKAGELGYGEAYEAIKEYCN